MTGTGPTSSVWRPETGELLAEVPDAGIEQVDEAVRAARKAFDAWSGTTPAGRAKTLLSIADAIESHADELAELESRTAGKPLQRVREDEIHHIVDPFRFFAGAIRCLQGPLAGQYVEAHTSLVRRDAIGVVGLIAPWNYPLMMAVWKLAPALAAGNTVVLKPAEQTPLSVLRLAAILSEHLPAGVFNVVTGRGETVGAHLVGHPDVALVSLTGDIGTGKIVAASAAATLKRVHLELGGKAPVIVFGDADIGAVVDAVCTGGYYNAGQDCTAACRVFAAADVYDDLVARLTERVSALDMGPLDAPGTELGPLISREHRDRVVGFTDRAVALAHTEVTTGGKVVADRDGFYFEPTVVAHARPGDELVEKEVFGPVVSVSRFERPEDMVAEANASTYGLASSVWTRDLSRAMNVSQRLQYGCVWVNQHLVWPTEMPHGGMKMSGVGKEMSVYGLEDYTVVRHIMIAHPEEDSA